MHKLTNEQEASKDPSTTQCAVNFVCVDSRLGRCGASSKGNVGIGFFFGTVASRRSFSQNVNAHTHTHTYIQVCIYSGSHVHPLCQYISPLGECWSKAPPPTHDGESDQKKSFSLFVSGLAGWSSGVEGALKRFYLLLCEMSLLWVAILVSCAIVNVEQVKLL